MRQGGNPPGWPRVTKDAPSRGGHAQHIAKRVRPNPRIPKFSAICFLVEYPIGSDPSTLEKKCHLLPVPAAAGCPRAKPATGSPQISLSPLPKR